MWDFISLLYYMKNKNINSISNSIDRKLLLIVSVTFAFLLFVTQKLHLEFCLLNDSQVKMSYAKALHI